MSLTDPQALTRIRHECTTSDVDSGIHFTYKEHDLYNYAIEEILDSQFNVNITIIFTKLDKGEEWNVHIESSPLDPSKEAHVISFFPYIRAPSPVTLRPHVLSNGITSPVAYFSQDSTEYFLVLVSGDQISFDLTDFPSGSESMFSQVLANMIVGDSKGKKPVTGLLESKFKKSGNFFVGQDNLFLSNDIISSRLIQQQGLVLTHSRSFNQKFDETYSLAPQYRSTGKLALSNLFGGLGYWYGHSTVSQRTRKGSTSLYTTPDHSHFGFSPSRSSFPRGFVWDDGFHLMVAIKFDPMIAIEVLDSWVSLIDDDGWLAREQILGPESQHRVPSEFRVQHKHVSNPPALILPMIELLKIYKSGDLDSDVNDLIREKLSNWIHPIPDHCLSSGLDDYPRGRTVHDNDAHVDLSSWMCWAFEKLSQISNEVGGEEIVVPKVLNNCKADLNQFWSEKRSFFGDLWGGKEDGKTVAIPHHGYVGLFPLMLCQLDENDEKIDKILNIVADPEKLFSVGGIRSLSKKSKYFGSGEDYWCGPVWINMNYLLLQSLKNCYWSNVNARQVYADLRDNVVSNIHENLKTSGWFWEQYNGITGKGQKNKPFTGWTALVLNILSEEY
ncbi:hypothetical protein GEMRC1_006745 [Eukaryota sp. GEM-RC1]